MSKAVQARLEAPGPKRMLALDGGGVRGIITLAFLEHVEQLLAKRSKNPEAFRLSDYFDLIGGTSVGSITAVLLAMGYKVSEVTEIFFDWIPEIFANPLMPVPGVLPRFDARKLTNRIRGVLRDRPLETDDLKTGFAIMAKRVDTGSPWILTNNPKSTFWEDEATTIGNRHYRLGGADTCQHRGPLLLLTQDHQNSHERGQPACSSMAASPRTTARRCRCSCSRN